MYNTSTSQNLYEANHQALVNYFLSGIKDSRGAHDLGVEVEHFVVVASDDSPVSYFGNDDHPGVRDILGWLLERYPKPSWSEEGALMGSCATNGTSISIEPAAQLEISIAPYTDIAGIAQEYRAFCDFLNPRLAAYGLKLCHIGYHPTARAHELPLIPKDRYDFMDRYFIEIGSLGQRMMRATASTQVSIDYTSEADAIRKMRITCAIAPILAFITDNTPIYEGRANEHRLTRLLLYRDVDIRRCGTPPGIFETGFGFKDYAEWLLDNSPIFVTRPMAGTSEPVERYVGLCPSLKAYDDAPMSKNDIEHLISMFWPDVRLKRFVEIRPADCLPEPQILGYTALIKGLYYSTDSLEAIEDLIGVRKGKKTEDLWPLTTGDPTAAAHAIADAKHPFDVVVYGRRLGTWYTKLFSFAAAALPPEEQAYLDALYTWSLSGASDIQARYVDGTMLREV